MKRHPKHEAAEHAYPLWLRVLTLACLLLVAGASTVDAVHIHGQWLPHHAAQAGAAADGSQMPSEDNCPLCVAMHSALPVSAELGPVQMLLVAGSLVQGSDRAAESSWQFAMFSRPPPAAESIPA